MPNLCYRSPTNVGEDEKAITIPFLQLRSPFPTIQLAKNSLPYN